MTEPATPEDHASPRVASAALRPSLEAMLMIADQPLPEAVLASAVGHRVPDVAAALAALVAEYDEQDRGFELRHVAGGWRYYTREAYAPVVEAYVLEGQQARLTQAALETLAVIAYRQPISRARVSAVRGVSVDGVMRTLIARGLVQQTGTDPESGAAVFATTGYFLERIGVTSLDDLPELAPYLPDLADLEDELTGLAGPGAGPGAGAGPGTQPEPPDPAEDP